MDTIRAERGRMTGNRRDTSSFWNIKNIFVLIWCLVVAVSVGLVTAAQIGIDSVPGVMPGVTVGGYSVSGDSYNGVLENMHDIASVMEGQTVVLTGQGGEAYPYSAKQLGATVDAEAMAKEAYGVCRTQNILENAWSYWRLKLVPYEIMAVVTLDPTKIDSTLVELEKRISVRKIDGKFIAYETEITLLEGRDGITLNKDESKAAIFAVLQKIQYQGAEEKDIVVPLSLSVTEAQKLDLDQLAAASYREPKDAVWEKNENGKLILQPHVDGVQLNVDLAKIKIEKAMGNLVVMPLTVIKPELTTEIVEATLLSDVLATYTTTMVVNPDRTHNVSLAAKKINKTVLMPGEVFSFNKVVGPRTYETGFKDAKIYVKDEIVDGVGGGICQVTSTLYMTTLMADLQTVERRNHRFTVSYIPLGYDATVAYGTIDFRFANNQDYPIEINAEVKGQKLTISLLGTIAQPDKTVELTTETYNPKTFATKKKDSPGLTPGTTKVEQRGAMGYSVDTYKTVKVGESVISSEKIHTSVYSPCDEIILVGPPVPEEPEVPVDPSVPEEPEVPVDPSDSTGQEPPYQLDPSYIIEPWLIQ
jgi:vancomycin resistance protein YoaR